MASFNLFNRFQTWFGDEGQLLTGGYFKFYAGGTTTPADVYPDSSLGGGTALGSTVYLDASGRLLHECWGDASLTYFVELYDSDNVKQADFDDVGVPGGPAQVIPIPDEDEYLGGDGTNFIAKTYTGLPDPTGQANKILSTDGTDFIWIAKPADGENGASDITVTSSSVKWSDGTTTVMEQFGNATATNGATRTCSKSVSFGTAFTATPVVTIVPTFSAAPTTGGNVYPHWDITAVSTTGFTVTFSTYTGGTSADSSNTNSVISSDVPFAWSARGTVA